MYTFVTLLDKRFLTITYILLVCPILLFACRTWAFTVKPLLQPDEPQELPYWIPYLGHAINFVKNGQQVLTRGREYFGNTREPFALTLGGEKIYFLTNAGDVAAVHKNTSAFIFDRVVYELSIQFGVSPEATAKIHRKPQSQDDDVVCTRLQLKNPRLKTLQHLNSEFFKKQLHPGEQYDIMLEQYTRSFDNILRLANLVPAFSKQSDCNRTIISLHRWTQDTFMEISTKILFGEKLQEMDQDMIKNFLVFDDDNWKLWYKWPRSGDMYNAKAKVIETLRRYLELPREERSSATWLMQIIEDSQKALDISNQDIATNLMMMYWGSVTNTWKLCFWALAYILHNPGQLDLIHEETQSAFLPDGSISHPHLSSSCPRLEAILLEILRFRNAGSSIRIANEPVIIGGKRFRPGDRLVCPSRQLHFDSDIYGPDPSVFDPDRFIRDKSLVKSEGYRPFGGGLSLCPGRFIAKQTVKVFIMLVLSRFEMGLVGEQAFPAMELKPTTGLMSPAKGEDVLMSIRPLM